jgi:hypothetical protein
VVVTGAEAGGAGSGAGFKLGLSLGIGWLLGFAPKPLEASTNCDSDDECSNESRK